MTSPQAERIPVLGSIPLPPPQAGPGRQSLPPAPPWTDTEAPAPPWSEAKAASGSSPRLLRAPQCTSNTPLRIAAKVRAAVARDRCITLAAPGARIAYLDDAATDG